MKKEKFLKLLDKTIPLYLGMFILKSATDNELALSNLVAPEVLAPTCVYAALMLLSQPLFTHFEKHGAKDLYGYWKNKREENKKTKTLKM